MYLEGFPRSAAPGSVLSCEGFPAPAGFPPGLVPGPKPVTSAKATSGRQRRRVGAGAPRPRRWAGSAAAAGAPAAIPGVLALRGASVRPRALPARSWLLGLDVGSVTAVI